MEDAVDLLLNLLSIESTPEKGTEEISAFITGILEDNGFDVELQGNEEKNIIARKGEPEIGVLAHMDTVPVGGNWRKNPFGEKEGGLIFGRGACDVKGGLAAALSAGIKSDECFLVFTFGEELGMLGAKSLDMSKLPDAMVVVEPTSLNVVHSHKGALAVLFRSRGVSAHASDPSKGKNAIEELIGKWESIREKIRNAGCSFNLGTIKGGSRPNIVPELCEATVDIRFGSDEERKAALDAFSEVEHEILVDLPSLSGQEQFARRISSLLGTGMVEINGCTEAGILALAGKDAVVFGPGDMKNAHAPDEHISLEELNLAEKMFEKLFKEFKSGRENMS